MSGQVSELKEYIRVSDDNREITFVYKADNKEFEDKAIKYSEYFVIHEDYIFSSDEPFVEDDFQYKRIHVSKPDWRGAPWAGVIN